jgi:head-tail adaptor
MKWPSLDPGELRHQITILGPVPATDVSGSTVALVPLVTCYAKIEVVKGLDVIRAGQETTQIYLIVSMWWQAGIAANMQVQALNGLYLIESVENVLELDVVLKLNCLAIGKNA